MDCIDNYKDLCTDIEVQECIVEDIENELTLLKKLMMNGPKDITGIDYSRGPGGQAICISMDRILDRMNRIEKRLDVEKEILNKKIATKYKIDGKIKELTGIDAKVIYLRDIEGKTLQEIADIIGYSKRHIERISSRNKKLAV